MLVRRLGAQVNRVLRHFGVQVTRSNPYGVEWQRSQLMRARSISAVIDVGANAGQYGEQLRRQGYSGSIYSFEPIPAAFAALRERARPDSKWKVFELAVSDTAAQATLNIAGNSVSSSILEMAKRHVDAEPASKIVSTIEVRTTTLNDILRDMPEQPTMLKIDTQGSEDRVLAGGMSMLHRVHLLETELSLFEVYLGQTLFRDMDARIAAAGFDLVSLAGGLFDRHTGELLQVDAIYTRRTVPAKGVNSGPV